MTTKTTDSPNAQKQSQSRMNARAPQSPSSIWSKAAMPPNVQNASQKTRKAIVPRDRRGRKVTITRSPSCWMREPAGGTAISILLSVRP